MQASTEGTPHRQTHDQQWDSSRPPSTGFMRASPFAAWSPAQPELPLPPGDLANQRRPWQPVSRSPSGPARKASSTIPAGRLLSTNASLLSTADMPPPSGRVLPTRRDRQGEMDSQSSQQTAAQLTVVINQVEKGCCQVYETHSATVMLSAALCLIAGRKSSSTVFTHCSYEPACTAAMDWLTSAYSCVPCNKACYISSERISAAFISSQMPS